VLAAGCAGQTVDTQGADLTEGKELFLEKCGGCHTLAAAGTNGTVGPNLDNAFGASRDQGFDDSTFFEVVLEQMKIPGNGSPMPKFDDKADAANYLT
jgi:cytochrome c2